MTDTNQAVCMLAPNLTKSAGGVVEAILGQSQGLANAGRNVKLIGLEAPQDRPDLPSDFHSRTVPIGRNRAFDRASGLSDALDESRAGILHLHGLWFPSVSINARRWKARTTGQLVLSPHGMLDPWALANSKWKKRVALLAFERRTLNMVDCIHALNVSELRSIRAMRLTAPVAVIPNGVDLPDLSHGTPPPPVGQDLRKVLLFLGRLHPKKGISETLNAWARAIADDPALGEAWRVVIAGWDDGGYRQELEQVSRDLGLQSHVSFPGPVFGKEKATLLASCSAFILASHSEGLPMSVLEAWSYEKPVFMTSACNLAEGFAADAAVEISTEADHISRVLQAYLSGPHLPEVGRNGRRLVEAGFSWGNVGQQLDQLYSWLLDRQRAAPECLVFS